MAAGDIGSQLDDWEYATNVALYPSIVHVHGDVYAMAWKDSAFPGSGGKLMTFTIDDGGTIGSAIANHVYYATSGTVRNRIFHLTGDVYAITYRGADSDGFITTVEIHDDGTIPGNIGTYAFDTDYAGVTDLTHVTGDIYALVYYGGSGRDIFIKTIEIADDGTITTPYKDTRTVEANPSSWQGATIVRRSYSIVAVSYCGPNVAGRTGTVKTYSISSAGVISMSPIDSMDYETTTLGYPDLIHVKGSMYAVAYNGGVKIKTFTIDNSGNISSVVGALSVSGVGDQELRIIHGGGDMYALVSRDGAGVCWVVTVDIKSNGTVTELDKKQIAGYGLDPDICHVTGDVYAIPHQEHDNDQWVDTWEIETPSDAIISPFRFTSGLSHRSMR